MSQFCHLYLKILSSLFFHFHFHPNLPPFQTFFSLCPIQTTLFQTFFSSSLYLLFILFSLCLTLTNHFLNLSFFLLNRTFFLSVSPKRHSLSNLLFFFKLSFVYSFFSLSHPNDTLSQSFFLLQTIFCIFFFLDKKESKNQGLRGGG